MPKPVSRDTVYVDLNGNVILSMNCRLRWIPLDPTRIQWLAFVVTVMNHRVP
jgi:hypothetical protein